MTEIQLSQWLHAHILWILLFLGAAFTFVWLLIMQKRLKLRWYAALLLAVLHTVYGVLCVKLFAFAENGFQANDLSSMSLFGAVFLMPLAYWLGAKLFKRKPSDVFDIFVICMIFTLLCARCNCLFAGCCLGKQIPGTETRFPTREAELLFYLVFLGIFVPRVRKGRTRGEVYPLYMTAYGVFRFITEFFREASVNTVFHISHIWAGVAAVLGLVIYMEIKRRKPNKSQAKAKKQSKTKKR